MNALSILQISTLAYGVMQRNFVLNLTRIFLTVSVLEGATATRITLMLK